MTVAGPVIALDSARSLTQYAHRIWQNQQGLPGGTVNAIVQTHDGYLWLGLPSGLFKFDGVRFSPAAGLAGNPMDGPWVSGLLEDHHHRLWIATDGHGLYCREGEHLTRFTVDNGLRSDVVSIVIEDLQGDIWAGCNGGLCEMKPSDGGRFKPVDAPGHAPLTTTGPALTTAGAVSALISAADGSVYFSYSDDPRLYRWANNQVQSIGLDVPGFTAITALLCDADGSVWVGSSQGLIRLHDGQQTRFTTAQGLSDDSVRCLTVDAAGSVYVGTTDGLCRLQGGQIESLRAEDGLSQSTVSAVAFDHEGSLWVGTKHGLNQFFDRRSVPFTTSEGLPSNNVSAVLQKPDGVVVVATLDAGLCRFDGNRFPVRNRMSIAQGLPSVKVLSLADDDGDPGGFWVGTDQGACRVEGDQIRQRLTMAEGLPSPAVTHLLMDARHQLWIGTPAGLRKWTADAGVTTDGINSMAATRILGLSEYRGAVAVATEAGIFAVSDVSGPSASVALLSGPTDARWVRQVQELYEDPQHRLWIGTRGQGLHWIDAGGSHGVALRNGLFDDDISSITADDQGHLWMGCSKGVFWIDPAPLLGDRANAPGNRRAEPPRVFSNPFSPTDNQRTIECRSNGRPGVCKTRDGKIWFATLHGVMVFDPAHLQRGTAVPSTVINEVSVNGAVQPGDTPLRLTPGQNNLEFRYTGLSFLTPAFMHFRYQLQGFDHDWVDAGLRREAFYTNLPPGDYTFKVQAGNPAGGFGNVSASVAVTLLPRFYQHVWFWPLVVVILILIAIGMVQLRIARLRQNVNAILAERSRIARELHDTLLQGLSGVTMEMQALLMRLGKTDEGAILEGIIQDAGDCMRDARRSVAGLRSARGNEGLVTAITQAATQLTEATTIRLKLKLSPIPASLTPETEYNLLRMTQEAINNAVKHSGASSVEVSLVHRGANLVLTVKDDGRGFDPSAPAPGEHYGIVGIRERAGQVHAAVDIRSRPGHGSSVVITLALKPAAIEPPARPAAPAAISQSKEP